MMHRTNTEDVSPQSEITLLLWATNRKKVTIPRKKSFFSHVGVLLSFYIASIEMTCFSFRVLTCPNLIVWQQRGLQKIYTPRWKVRMIRPIPDQIWKKTREVWESSQLLTERDHRVSYFRIFPNKTNLIIFIYYYIHIFMYTTRIR